MPLLLAVWDSVFFLLFLGLMTLATTLKTDT